MRLTPDVVEAIRDAVQAADSAAEVYLHGSRLGDAARGGDIDLLVVSDALNLREILRLRRTILDRIGWQQLDLTVRRRDQLDEPFAADCLSRRLKL